MFENRVLRGIFSLRKWEGTGNKKELYNKELHNLYYLVYFTRMTKLRLILAEHVARMNEKCT
jgi:hypothetical protein